MPSLSIIIPTLNEEHYIKPLLTSIAKQTRMPKEVIVIDGGSTDGTIRIVKTFANKIPLKLMEWSKGISVQRNAAAKVATGDILLFLDADTELDRNFVAHATREFAHRKLDVAHAYFRLDSTDKTLFDRLGGWLIARYFGIFQYSKNPMCNGFCIFSTPEMFAKLGGFNEMFQHSEDHDYAWRAVRSGGRFRMLKKPGYKLSNRRYVEQGRAKLLGIYAKAEANRIFFRYKYAPREQPIYSFGIFTRKH